MNESWVRKFEERFSIRKPESTIFKIIIGEKPYLQSLNNVSFAVKYADGLYSNIGQVAFLVNRWIKIQDSLEMIFNLLYTPDQSISVLTYLRENGITAKQFAEYLMKQQNLVLVNRYSKQGKDNKTAILKIVKDIKKANKKIICLFVGQKSVNSFSQKDLSGLEYGVAIHPSGINLNNKSTNSRYFQVWYKLNDKQLYKKSAQFTLNNFLQI